ncbi:MAG: transposase [Firmicutes bacterium]|nr:transposase [Bacillota bacterium]
MQLKKLTQPNYTTFGNLYQLKLPLNIEYIIPNDDSVRLLGQIVEKMNLTGIYQSYSRFRNHQASPKQMLKILVYAYMNRFYSSRKIEIACKRDINFMYLLEGSHAPDHATIARFRNLHFAPVAKAILTQMTHLLADNKEISFKNLFIDGTKMEAASNKYTFVWKKTVSKNQKKLMDKIPLLFQEVEDCLGIKIVHSNRIKQYHLKKLRRQLKRLQSKEGIVFVHGIGKKRSVLQKKIEQLDEYIRRLKQYNQYLHIAGNRNSFSKTDHDATFMRMKEDSMKNGQLKPAYNLQFGVDSEYVVWITAGPQPTDTTTLIPFLDDLKQNLGRIYPNVITDSGYESEENYMYLQEKRQTAYIKPSNYEQSKSRKYKTDIGRRENMIYDAEGDYYLCSNQKKIIKTGTRKVKSKTGYSSEKTCYACEECKGCLLQAKCIKGNNSKLPLEERSKHFEVSKRFQQKREESLTRIKTQEGKLLRMNRSIQSEGAFGEVKEDMGFRRFLCRGQQNILAESILLGLAHNVNKLHNKIQNGRCGSYLHPLKTA